MSAIQQEIVRTLARNRQFERVIVLFYTVRVTEYTTTGYRQWGQDSFCIGTHDRFTGAWNITRATELLTFRRVIESI